MFRNIIFYLDKSGANVTRRGSIPRMCFLKAASVLLNDSWKKSLVLFVIMIYIMYNNRLYIGRIMRAFSGAVTSKQVAKK